MAVDLLFYCLWNIKDQNDESVDLKWSISLELQQFIDNDRVHEYSPKCRQQILCCCQGM